MTSTCIICFKDIVCNPILITKKGAESINVASKERNSDVVASEGSSVHSECRKRFTDKKDIKRKQKQEAVVGEQSASKSVTKSKRARLTQDERHTICLFCSQKVTFGCDSSKVEDHNFTKTILECCEARCDEWAFIVKGKIEFYEKDLPAADCVYHHVCATNFRTNRNVPSKYSDSVSENQSGRPENQVRYAAFREVCDSLEWREYEKITLPDLVEAMENKLVDTEFSAYSKRYMKERLLEFYGTDITVISKPGMNDIFVYSPDTSTILRKFYGQSKDVDIELQKIRLIETAASIIFNEVKEKVPIWLESYPTVDSSSKKNSFNFVPPLLRLFLSTLFQGKDTNLKVASIGQAIIQASRPRAVKAPLQFSLTVLLHHHYRSKYLIDVLHALGFCLSYKEALKFERCASVLSGYQFDDSDGETLKFSADNVDHNICTLDGKGTFHGMGMIACLSNAKFNEMSITRRKVPDDEILAKSTINLVEYHDNKQLLKLKFQKLTDINFSSYKTDVLWKLGWYFKNPIPDWNGCMRLIYDKQSNSTVPSKDVIVNLPIIDLDPGNMSCILSTLTYLSILAQKHSFPAIITFDQPLFWKASQIILESEDTLLKSIVLMLGSFHTVMNLLGCVGKMMEGSGLDGILSSIYGENPIIHMLSGKAYSRAIRGNFFVDYALENLLFQMIDDSDLPLEQIEELYTRTLSGEIKVDDVEGNALLKNILSSVEKVKKQLAESSRTSKLWIEYQSVIKTIRELIRADRLGLWTLHLEAIQHALPIFAAAGHFNYAKSAYLYLQNMLSLKTNNPTVNQYFANGGFVVRRSERLWAGIGCDLTIEQVLMRSIKTNGGLTRGTGFSEIQRATWLLSKPVVTTYNQQFEECLGVLHSSSEQHKTVGATRLNRDKEDMKKIIEQLQISSPFNCEVKSLMNVVNGVVADKSANVDDFIKIGQKIISNMIDKKVFEYKFKRKDAAKTMSFKIRIGKSKDAKEIDPTLLCQRLLIAANSSTIETSEVFSYELSNYPPAIFESPLMLRKSDKSQIVDCITKLITTKEINNHNESSENDISTPLHSFSEESIDHKYVLDGGSLLRRLKWKKETTYNEIASTYAEFVKKHYGNATVVFDGYLTGPSTKDNTHARRSTLSESKKINFDPGMKFSGTQKKFLSNDENKARIIRLIGSHLEMANCSVVYCQDDADVDIAVTACKIVLTNNVTVVGEDSDVLVLLLYYSTIYSSNYKLIYKSDKSASKYGEHDIFSYRDKLGKDMCTYFLFLHAYSGCDTTSSFFGFSKQGVFKFFQNNVDMQFQSKVFTNVDSSQKEIEIAGLKVTFALYGGRNGESIAELRGRLMSEKVLKSSVFVSPERLPPTEGALKYHSYRTYHQIMTWIGMNISGEDWGWYVRDGKFFPKTMDQNYAPDKLLEVVHCGCKTGCTTLRCTCKCSGLSCTYICGSCQTDGCSNSAMVKNVDSIDDE